MGNPGAWDDPRIQGFLREWIQNAERCLKRVEPGLSLDRYGRFFGRTRAGGRIDLNFEPDGIPQQTTPSSREYFYLFVVSKGIQEYPFTPQQYALSRLEGASLPSLIGCSP